MTLLCRILLWLFGVFLLVQGFHAYGQTPTTRTHACTELEDTLELAQHIATHGLVNYPPLVAKKLATGACREVIVPAIPPPYPPLAIVDAGDFSIHIRLVVTGDNQVFFALLLTGDLSNIARDVEA